ncbi:MAG: homoserine dehydrogenase [Phycisphaerae bacterium]|nr:homoserine dehydrogenase [Phycisphaerae bacterium]
MAEKCVNIALIGFGIVGSGVAKIILEKADHISRRTGLRLVLRHIVDTDLVRSRPVAVPEGILHSDLDKVVHDPEVQIAIVLVGGTTVAGEIQKRLLAAGKDVVTANKALLAERGDELFEVARTHGRSIAFEASCCGGIPLISSIRTGLSANDISAMYGIVNGTCNYILSSMFSEGKEYGVALKESQEAGFAEADPSLDVNGADSAHKLAILALLAFGQSINYDDISVVGIDQVNLVDVNYGKEMGYVMKLLAIAEMASGGLTLSVRPAFIRKNEPLAQVSGPFNAVSVFGDAVGHTSYYGRGAGMMPTASAVVADVIETAHGNTGRLFAATPGLGRPAEAATLCPAEEIQSRYYLRLTVGDQPGVFARIAKILGDRQISIASCIQHESKSSDSVPLVITTHCVRQGDMDRAIEELAAMVGNKAEPVCIHVLSPPCDGQ